MPARRTHQTPCNGRRSTTTTWEGGALGGVEEGRSQRSPTMLKPVLGGVHSPSVVAPPECWPAEGEAVSGRLWATTGWCPSKPACSVALIILPHLCNNRAEPQAPPKHRGYQDGGYGGHLIGGGGFGASARGTCYTFLSLLFISFHFLCGK